MKTLLILAILIFSSCKVTLKVESKKHYSQRMESEKPVKPAWVKSTETYFDRMPVITESEITRSEIDSMLCEYAARGYSKDTNHGDMFYHSSCDLWDDWCYCFKDSSGKWIKRAQRILKKK